MDTRVAPAPRRGGRPSTLSLDLILTEALKLLDEVGVQSFSVNKLAKRLNVSAMSFYNYFNSVDALLQAVAEHVFTLFPMPAPTSRWQDFVSEWLNAMAGHVQRYPVALKVIAWNGNLSAGWLRAWLPVLEIIAAHEHDPERRRSIAYWLSLSAVGVMNARVYEPESPSRLPAELSGSVSQAQLELLSSLYGVNPITDSDAIVQDVFANIIRGLERLFDESR